MDQLLGMPDAGLILGCTSGNARLRLKAAGVPLVRINGKAWAVLAKDLEEFAAKPPRPVGRPRKSAKSATTIGS